MHPATISFCAPPEFLVFRHFQDGIHRFLLSRGDEAAGVDDQNVGFAGAWRDCVARPRENTTSSPRYRRGSWDIPG